MKLVDLDPAVRVGIGRCIADTCEQIGDRRFLQPLADECRRVLQRNVHQPDLAQARHLIDQRMVVDVGKSCSSTRETPSGGGRESNAALIRSSVKAGVISGHGADQSGNAPRVVPLDEDHDTAVDAHRP